MAKFRQVHVEFWQDGFVLDLTPEEKYFYIYLMTNSKTTQCGIYELPKRIIETETGYNRETVDKLLERFIDYGKIAYDDNTKEVMIMNWIKYNGIKSSKVVSCIKKELRLVKNKDYIKDFIGLCIQYEYPMDSLSIDLGEEREEEQEEEKEIEREEKHSRKSKIYDEESIHFQLALRLYEKILENNPDHKKPNLQKWSDDIRLMMERDGRTEEQIAYLIDWVQQDSFWKSNILSIDKLRKQYDQLVMKVKEQASKNNRRDGPNMPRAYQSLQDWADE